MAPASSLFKQTQEQSISGIMDDHPYSCLDSDDITHVVREFIRLNVSSLPVVNGDGRRLRQRRRCHEIDCHL